MHITYMMRTKLQINWDCPNLVSRRMRSHSL